MDRDKEQHPMIDIKRGHGVNIEDAATSGQRLLSAEDVTDLRVKGVSAGVNNSAKSNGVPLWMSTLITLISSLIVAYLVYKFGWN